MAQALLAPVHQTLGYRTIEEYTRWASQRKILLKVKQIYLRTARSMYSNTIVIVKMFTFNSTLFKRCWWWSFQDFYSKNTSLAQCTELPQPSSTGQCTLTALGPILLSLPSANETIPSVRAIVLGIGDLFSDSELPDSYIPNPQLDNYPQLGILDPQLGIICPIGYIVCQFSIM